MRIRTTIIGIVLLFTTSGLFSQGLSFRAHSGVSSYLGDLAPFNTAFSFSGGRPAIGLTASYAFNPELRMSFRFMRGTLQGSDANSSTLQRQRRNLSFTSPITEYGVTVDYYISEALPFIGMWGVDLYVYGGLMIFKFNPMSMYDGELIELQPLGTEGQGVFEFGNLPKYRLVKIGIPLGMGLTFDLSQNVKLGIEVGPRITFTDYLDDVSGNYVDYQLQAELQGELTAKLSNRIAEFERAQATTPSELEAVPSFIQGSVRGNPENNDWYLFTNVIFGYRLGQLGLGKTVNPPVAQ